MNTIRVHSPSPAILVCGGPTDVSSAIPPSLRDAFLRIQPTMKIAGASNFNTYEIIQAETLTRSFAAAEYTNILQFETDIAQLCDLTLLFVESFGSAAELGAFAVIDEIAQRTLVVMEDYYYEESSFIRLGPVQSLESNVSHSSVCVLSRDDIGITAKGGLASLQLATFSERMSTAISARLTQTRDPSTFDSRREGHLAKLIVGFIQHYGGLTSEEIEMMLAYTNIYPGMARLLQYLVCCEAVGWVVSRKRGVHRYYVAVQPKEAIGYRVNTGSALRDKVRWRSDIIENWKATDPERFGCIASVRAGKS